MKVNDAIKKRRSLRLLKKTDVSQEKIHELIQAAKLAPSCFNNQPWRYVFVNDQDQLDNLKDAYSDGNEWAYKSSLTIAVFSHKDLDCKVTNRRYYLFDTGISVGFILLKATELGLVTHPIAGFSQKKVKKILNIPDQMKVITLIIVGKKVDSLPADIDKKTQKSELNRPPRLQNKEFVFMNKAENARE